MEPPRVPPAGDVASKPPPAAEPADPAMRDWRRAVVRRDRQGIPDAEDMLRDHEDDYRESLMKMAVEDPDPRVRAFSVSVLGRFKKRPAEDYFIGRLGDPHEYPRESAALVLGRYGTSACLPALDRATTSDPVERLRPIAAKAAGMIRAREAR